MRVLGLDLGGKRIGLAISDETGRIALPLSTLVRKDPRRDLEALAKLASEREVERVVVGLPLHLDGRAGPEAERARSFARTLEKRLGLPVELVDERLTTALAERSLRETGRRQRRDREVVDAVAATLLLRTWLERPAPAGDAGRGA